MSMRFKKTLAMILSLVTVFSAAFTSMAEVPVGVEEPVEVAEIGDDQAVIPEEPASVIADVLDDAAIPDAEVDTVLEVEEVVEDDSAAEEEVVGETGEKLLEAATVYFYWWAKQNDDQETYTLYISPDTDKPSGVAASGTYSSSWKCDDKTVYFDNIKGNISQVVITDEITLGTSAADMFSGFSKLEEIQNMNNLDTSNVTTMSSMFKSCKALTSLDLSGFTTS